MEMLDFSGLAYFASIFGFVFVWVLMFAILIKTKILGDNAFINSIIALIFALVFISFSPGVVYVQTIIPWFAILIISIFFMMLIIGFSQKEVDKFMKPWMSWVFILVLLIIFLFSAVKVFNPFLAPYLPGSPDKGGDPNLIKLKNFIYSESFLGAALLLFIALIIFRILTKGK
ncbi:MAG: hypothetical protein QXJ28_01505 [Candidatus Pacearchaeota archaeon]